MLGLVVPGTGSAAGTLTYSDLAPVFRTGLVHVPPGKGASGGKNCPTGFHVLTGGAWFNELGQLPEMARHQAIEVELPTEAERELQRQLNKRIHSRQPLKLVFNEAAPVESPVTNQ